jgi:hypothetical protein
MPILLPSGGLVERTDMKRILIVVAAGSLLAFVALAGSFTNSKTPGVSAARVPIIGVCRFPDALGVPGPEDPTSSLIIASHRDYSTYSCDGSVTWSALRVTKFGDAFCEAVFGPGATGSATVWPSGKASFSCRVPLV